MVDAVPPGYHTVTPYLTVRGAEALIDFLKAAFDAKELHRMAGADGSVRHAEVLIGDSHVMIGEAQPEWPPMPSMLYLYLTSSDATYDRAIAAGGTSLRAPQTEFYGDRVSAVQDRWGNQWWLATHVEDVSAEEMHHRHQEAEKARHKPPAGA
jgi:PhnB protein